MAVDLDPFVTVKDLSVQLGIATPERSTITYQQMAAALAEASDDLRSVTGQALNRGTSTARVMVRPGAPTALPAVPIVSVESVTDADGNPVEFELIDSKHIEVSTRVALRVTVAYTHGWEDIPGDLKKWVKVLAAAQLSAAQTGTLGLSGGLAAIRVDDGQATFATRAGESGEGVEIPERVQQRLRTIYGSAQLVMEWAP